MTDAERYDRALHAMQTGVKMEIERGGVDADIVADPRRFHKHLRVGINSAHVSELAVAKLLIAKGVFTEEEYIAAVADAMENEVRLYEERLSKAVGVKITLG